MPSFPPSSLRRIVVACFVALIVLGIVWEIWLAPLRPGAWLLSLKVVPLVFALPGIAAARVRSYQWWSMLILGYLAEGVVRAASDAGLSARLAWVETMIAVAAFTAIVLYVRRVRRDALPPG
ncbi:MAG: DUF2069 domain-containing protein [Burkholderiaceae bacterium]|nr:DUF2069 domain-containing protein [Burkholderiaceae bacterium]